MDKWTEMRREGGRVDRDGLDINKSMDEVTRFIKEQKGTKVGEWEREKREKWLLWLSLLPIEIICRRIPLSLTTRQCQGVFVHVCASVPNRVHLCVCLRACALAHKLAFHH